VKNGTKLSYSEIYCHLFNIQLIPLVPIPPGYLSLVLTLKPIKYDFNQNHFLLDIVNSVT